MREKMNAGEICTRATVFAYKHMSVSESARLMLEHHVGSLVVVEESDKGRVIDGMLTDEVSHGNASKPSCTRQKELP